MRAAVVCGWQSIIEKHPSADRCSVGKKRLQEFRARFVRRESGEKELEDSRPSDLQPRDLPIVAVNGIPRNEHDPFSNR